MKFLIVDDEPLARSDYADVVGEAASDGAAAAARARVRAARAVRPPAQISGFPITSLKLLIGEREHRFYPLNAETIDYIESDRNYVTLRTRNSKYISRDTIKRLCVELEGLGFVQIERSLLLNIRAVVHVESVGRGTFAFTLSSGVRLQSSTSYREAILKVLPMRRYSGRKSPP
ncbi:MAG TPA: LytTR family DNA-binding domain-containing protein [Steroidobacteraceae bacterium]